MEANSRGAGMTIRPGTVADAGVAAELHAGQIGEGFLSLLGPAFLRRLYRRITISPWSFLLVAENDGKPIGFIAGCTDVRALYRTFLIRDGIVAALTCCGRLLRSWRRVLETLRYGSEHGGFGAELLAIAVDPRAQGNRVGSLLVDAFLEEIANRNEEAAYVVVAAKNVKAVALYQGTGFRTAERFEMHAGTESLVMQWGSRPSVNA